MKNFKKCEQVSHLKLIITFSLWIIPPASLTSVHSASSSARSSAYIPAISSRGHVDRTDYLINRFLSANLAKVHNISSNSNNHNNHNNNNNNQNNNIHRSDQPTTVLPETFYQQELNRRLHNAAGFASHYSFLPIISNRNEYRRQTAHLNLNAIRPTDGSTNIDVDLRDLIHKELEERSKFDPILSPRGASQSGSQSPSSPSSPSSSPSFHPSAGNHHYNNHPGGVNLFALLRPNGQDVLPAEGNRRGGSDAPNAGIRGQASDQYEANHEDSSEDVPFQGMKLSSSPVSSIVGNKRGGGTHKPSMNFPVASLPIDGSDSSSGKKMDGMRVGDRITVRKNSSATTGTPASAPAVDIDKKTKKKTNGHSHAPQKEISLIPLVPNPDDSSSFSSMSSSSSSSPSSSGILQQNHRHLNQPNNMPTRGVVTSMSPASSEVSEQDDSFTSTSLSSSTSISLSPHRQHHRRGPSPATASPSLSSSPSSSSTSRSPDQSSVSHTSSDRQHGHDSFPKQQQQQHQNHHLHAASDKIQKQQQQQQQQNQKHSDLQHHNSRHNNSPSSGNHAPAGSHHHFDSSSSGSSNIHPKVVAFVTHVDPPPTRFPRPGASGSSRHRSRHPGLSPLYPTQIPNHAPAADAATTPSSPFQVPVTASSSTTTTSSSGILPTYTEKPPSPPPSLVISSSRKPADWSTRNHQQTSSQSDGNTAADIVRKYYEEIIKNSQQQHHGSGTRQEHLPHRPRAGVLLPTTIPGTVPANSTETISLLGSSDHGHHHHGHNHQQDPSVIHNNHVNEEDSESGNSADGSAHVNSAVPTVDPVTGDSVITISPKSTTSPTSKSRDDEVIDFIFGMSGKEDQPYRMTTERLAYILIGSCCALSILCLIIVAFSIRCRDMCDEYRAWKKAEKLAVYSHLRYNQQQHQQQSFPSHQYPLSTHVPHRHHASSNLQSVQQQQQQQQSQQRHHVMRMNAGRNATTSASGIETLHDPYGPNEADSSLLPLPPPPPLHHSSTGVPGGIHHPHSGLMQQSNTSRPIFGPSCCCCPSTSSNFTTARAAAATTITKRQSSSDSCPRGYFHPTPRGKLPFGAASSLHQLFPATGNNNRQQAAGIHLNPHHHPSNSMSDHMEEGDSLDSVIDHDHAGSSPHQECTCSEPVYVDLAPGQASQQQQHQRKKAATTVYKNHQSKNNHQQGSPHDGGGGGGSSSNPSWIQSSIIVDELHRKHANLRNHNNGKSHAAATVAAVIGHRTAAAAAGGGSRGNNLQCHSKAAPSGSGGGGGGGSPPTASSANHSSNIRSNGHHRQHQQHQHHHRQQNPNQGRLRSDQHHQLKHKRPEDGLIFWSGNDDRLI